MTSDAMQQPYLGRVYCQKCGLLMVNGFCLHGSVNEVLAREFAAGRGWFGAEVVIDRFHTATRGR